MGEPIEVRCICGAEHTIADFPVDEKGITKRDVIELSRHHRLQKCPSCDPTFTGEELDFKPALE